MASDIQVDILYVCGDIYLDMCAWLWVYAFLEK